MSLRQAGKKTRFIFTAVACGECQEPVNVVGVDKSRLPRRWNRTKVKYDFLLSSHIETRFWMGLPRTYGYGMDICEARRCVEEVDATLPGLVAEVERLRAARLKAFLVLYRGRELGDGIAETPLLGEVAGYESDEEPQKI